MFLTLESLVPLLRSYPEYSPLNVFAKQAVPEILVAEGKAPIRQYAGTSVKTAGRKVTASHR